MKNLKYICSKCSRTFSRRWNAQRHNDAIHKGLSNIAIKYKSGNSVKAVKNRYGLYPSFSAASKSKEFKHLNQNDANDSSFKPFNNSGFHLKKPNKSVMSMGEGEKDDFLNNTLEKMAIPLEKLEKLFFGRLWLTTPNKNIQNILSCIVIAALAMPDPIKFIQDCLTYYNRQYYITKIIWYVAKSHGVDTFSATEILKNVLLSRYLYK